MRANWSSVSCSRSVWATASRQRFTNVSLRPLSTGELKKGQARKWLDLSLRGHMPNLGHVGLLVETFDGLGDDVTLLACMIPPFFMTPLFRTRDSKSEPSNGAFGFVGFEHSYQCQIMFIVKELRVQIFFDQTS
jgi:hypothetical protein